jgi:hypothetical protein
MRHIPKSSKRENEKIPLKFYKTMAVPAILYKCEVWGLRKKYLFTNTSSRNEIVTIPSKIQISVL